MQCVSQPHENSTIDRQRVGERLSAKSGVAPLNRREMWFWCNRAGACGSGIAVSNASFEVIGGFVAQRRMASMRVVRRLDPCEEVKPSLSFY